MSAAQQNAIGDVHLEKLRRLAEVVTPARPGFPTAEDADPHGEVLNLALGEFVRSVPRIIEYLDKLDPADMANLESLEATDPETFEIVCDLLVGRYLTCRPVWKSLGYPGRVPALPAAGEVEFYLRDGLLDPVIARGPIYTEPPG